MAAPKRSRLEIRRDRAEIAQHYCRRLSQYEIAEALNAPGTGRGYVISHDMVQDDLEAIQKQWRTDTARSLDEDKARELARIDHLERTYWQAWSASLEDKQRTVTKQGKGASGERVEAQVQKEGQTGNPAYLAGVQWCIERRAKLLGLDAAQRVELSGKGGGPVEVRTRSDLSLLSDEELDYLERINSRLFGSPGGDAGGDSGGAPDTPLSS